MLFDLNTTRGGQGLHIRIRLKKKLNLGYCNPHNFYNTRLYVELRALWLGLNHLRCNVKIRRNLYGTHSLSPLVLPAFMTHTQTSVLTRASIYIRILVY